MNDELLNIKLTESEVKMIMDALNGAIMPTPESQDLMHDLFEQVARHDDPDWNIDREPTEIDEGLSFTVAEDNFVNAGIQARERMKASSKAAARRDARLRSGQSEVDDNSIWNRPNDPTKW